MSFCVKCGSTIETDDLFCGNCGHPVHSNVSGSVSLTDAKKVIVDYFKSPINTTKTLIYSLEAKFTAIITAIILLLTAFIPFIPIKSTVSKLTKGLDLFGTDISSGINSKINGLFFTFLFYSILFFGLSTVLVLAYGAVRGKKESFLKLLNLVILCSIPAVLAMLLSLLFGINSFSLLLIIFGFTLSLIMFYSQLKQVLALSEFDSLIAAVIVNFLSYGITFFVAFESLKSKLSALENLF